MPLILSRLNGAEWSEWHEKVISFKVGQHTDVKFIHLVMNLDGKKYPVLLHANHSIWIEYGKWEVDIKS